MASFTISSLVTAPQVLANGQTGQVTASGDIVTQGAPAVTGSGRFSLTVQGEIRTTGTDAVFAANADASTVTVEAGGLITSSGGAAIAITADVISITNAGTIRGDITLTDTVTDSLWGINVASSGLVDGDITILGESQDFIDLRGGQVTGTVSAGLGSDRYYVDRTDVRIVEPDSQENSFDLIYSTVSYVLPANSNIEAIELLGTADINATATQNDRVWLYGNSGKNTLTGGDGLDFLQSNGGVDRMVGGAGGDLYISEGDDFIIEQAAGGYDSIRLYPGNPFVTSYTLTTNVEALENYTAIAVLNGNALDNSLVSSDLNATDETFDGRGGRDFMRGRAGDDTTLTHRHDTVDEDPDEGTDTILSPVSLTLPFYVENLTLTGSLDASAAGSNFFENTLIGNSGNNTLYGNNGRDILTGGAGKDSFVFSTSLANNNIDRITDFNSAADTIRLSDAVFAALAEGALSAAAFARNSTGQALDASDRIIYEADTGRLFYDSDGSGNAPRGHFATLAPGLALTNADFLVF